MTRNYTEAFKWFSRNEYSGFSPAALESKFELADCYEHGLGVKKSRSEAKRLYKSIAEYGHEGAQERLKKLSLLGFLF